MSERDDLVLYIYDEFKTAHGVRPRWIDFDAMSIEELREMADRVERDCIKAMERERAMNEAGAAEFEARIADIIASGAGDRATAVRWLRDAQGEYSYGDDDIRYAFNLDWGYELV